MNCSHLQHLGSMDASTRQHGRLNHLLCMLEKIRVVTDLDELEEEMASFAFDLLQIRLPQESLRLQQRFEIVQNPSAELLVFKKGDENLLNDLEAHGATATLLHTMRRFLYCDSFGTSPEFFNSATIALIHITFQNQARARNVAINGGIRLIEDMMKTYRDTDYIQIIGIAALIVLGKSIGLDNANIKEHILGQIIVAMEYHQETSRVYIVACSALGALFGPQSNILVKSGSRGSKLYHRVLTAISYGIILHVEDRVAQGVGHDLLCRIVGSDVAEEIIMELESSHCETVCAAAA